MRTQRPMLTKRGIASLSVAESNIRRSLPECSMFSVECSMNAKARCISSWKPIERHLSNSSMTTHLTASADRFCLSNWSFRRPGVAKTTCGFTSRSFLCSSIVGRPP